MLQENLARDDAPLTAEEWSRVDETVTSVAQKRLVGRRFINLFGPLGSGVQCIHQDTHAGVEKGEVGLMGEEEISAVHADTRDYMAVPMIYKDFWVYWRDIETSRKLGTPLDLSAAAAAAAFVAHSEDDLILNGSADLGLEGLMNMEGRSSVPMLNWDESGNAFQNAVDATHKLIDMGFYENFTMVVSPSLYAKMQRVFRNTGVLEIKQVRELMPGGVFQTPVLPENGAVVVATGSENLDLAVAQDIVTGYLGAEQMNHPFRVLESLILRVKRPEAICTLESGGEGKGKSK